MLLRPKQAKSSFHFLLKLFSKTNPRAQTGLIKAFTTNNPSYGLINAWSELEFQVRKNTDISFKSSASKQVISACTKTLSLSKTDQKRLKSISRRRNGVAHALGGRSSPTWSDVWFVLRVSKIQESESMIGIMMRTTLIVGAVAYAAGVMESSWRHYFHRYTNEQDRLTTGLIQEVKVIEEPKAKKSRGGKK